MEALILKHYNSASNEQLKDGETWYERAYNEALLLSQVFEIPLPKVVGIISALSPNNKWKRNLKDAWNLLETPLITTKCCTYTKQRQKALDILNGSGREAEILDILNGTKTRNFFTNILYYKDSQSVTVDTWAYRSVDLEPKMKHYVDIQTAYQNVAKQLNLVPHQLQAVVWGVVRGSVA